MAGLWACDCVKRCSVLVEAEDELGAIDAAAADCENAPFECKCEPHEVRQ